MPLLLAGLVAPVVGGCDDGGPSGRVGEDVPEKAPRCLPGCQTHSDCAVDFSCRSGVCWPSGCEAAADCLPLMSGWRPGCGADTPCVDGNVCINVDGVSYCAVPETPELGYACADNDFEARLVPLADGTGAATVCTQPRATCDDGECRNACRTDGHCSGERPQCNVITGRCECVEGSCETNASLCSDGQCLCQDDSDCTFRSVDTCYGGVCGCSSVALCRDFGFHPNSDPVCAPGTPLQGF